MSPWDILGWMLVGAMGIIALFLIGIMVFTIITVIDAMRERRSRKRARKRARQRSADMIRNARKARETVHTRGQ